MSTPVVSEQPHRLDEVFVLHARQLREGALLEWSSRFRNHQWLLDAARLQRHRRAWPLNFQPLPVDYRLVAKELIYAMLSGHLPSGEPRPKLGTIRSLFHTVGAFLIWLDSRPRQPGRPAHLRLTDLTGQDLLDYQRHLTVTVRNAGTRMSRRAGVRYLWRFRTVLTTDRLLFDPNHVEGWNEPPSRSVENATDRIPEPVHGPLLAWAIRFTDEFSPDILAADRAWRELRDAGRRAPIGTNRGPREQLRALLADYRARGRPLPGYRGAVNIEHLAAEAGCNRGTCLRIRTEIDAAVAVVGINEQAPLDIPITAMLDEKPWVDAIVVDHRADNGLGCLARLLQAAATIVILFLSGMREAEVKHLRRGCLNVKYDEQGRPYRWRVTSLAFKGEDDEAGVEATWTVGAPAARAIQVLEQLHRPDVDLLMAVLDHSVRNASATGRDGDAMTTCTTNRQLNDFVTWVNKYCARHGRTDGIPLVNKRPWRLITRQFRRTLAWFIARRPGGVIAGAIAYRHHAVHMFESYAGTSESGFRAEVESEQALARGEHLLAMIDQHEHKDLAGPAAGEAARRLEEFGDEARFQGTVVLDRRRLERLMKRGDPAIYPGKYATCVHRHETALCQQRRDSAGELRPDLGGCQPLVCRNVALTPDNIRNLRQEIGRIDDELTAPPLLPPLLHGRLHARRDEITTFLTRHQNAGQEYVS